MAEEDGVLVASLIVVSFWGLIAPLFMASRHYTGAIVYGLALGFGVVLISSLGFLRKRHKGETFIALAMCCSIMLMFREFGFLG